MSQADKYRYANSLVTPPHPRRFLFCRREARWRCNSLPRSALRRAELARGGRRAA